MSKGQGPSGSWSSRVALSLGERPLAEPPCELPATDAYDRVGPRTEPGAYAPAEETESVGEASTDRSFDLLFFLTGDSREVEGTGESRLAPFSDPPDTEDPVGKEG